MAVGLAVILFILTVIFWLSGLTVGIITLYRSFGRLTAGTKMEKLDEVLGQLGSELRQEKLSQKKFEREFVTLKETLPNHLQKIGLVRYNPFPDTGGNQSFSLAILDGRKSGLVITSLHSREGTRMYTKPVHEGASQGVLSREEQEAMKVAEGR